MRLRIIGGMTGPFVVLYETGERERRWPVGGQCKRWDDGWVLSAGIRNFYGVAIGWVNKNGVR